MSSVLALPTIHSFDGSSDAVDVVLRRCYLADMYGLVFGSRGVNRYLRISSLDRPNGSEVQSFRHPTLRSWHHFLSRKLRCLDLYLQKPARKQQRITHSPLLRCPDKFVVNSGSKQHNMQYTTRLVLDIGRIVRRYKAFHASGDRSFDKVRFQVSPYGCQVGRHRIDSSQGGGEGGNGGDGGVVPVSHFDVVREGSGGADVREDDNGEACGV